MSIDSFDRIEKLFGVAVPVTLGNSGLFGSIYDSSFSLVQETIKHAMKNIITPVRFKDFQRTLI